MKVKELIEKLKEMPQDMEVWMQVYDDWTYTVKDVEVVKRRSLEFVQIDNFKE